VLQLWVPTDRIPDHHPGEGVFNSSYYLSVFSYPETLTLASCNFVAGRSRTDNKLVSLAPGTTLTCEILETAFVSIIIPVLFFTWQMQQIKDCVKCIHT